MSFNSKRLNKKKGNIFSENFTSKKRAKTEVRVQTRELARKLMPRLIIFFTGNKIVEEKVLNAKDEKTHKKKSTS